MAEEEEPGEYIEKREDLHDCCFIVGTEKEKISTIKFFLVNYSPYFRAMLLETDMKEKSSKDGIPIPDHEPDVFKLMLSYFYGHHKIKFEDINQAMRFHLLVDKCLITKLKRKSIKYLMENCKSDVWEILECAVLLNIEEMRPRAESIVEEKTRALLTSPYFLTADPQIIEYILKQKKLRATEVELWRALVKWAEHKCGDGTKGNVLRKEINKFLKYIQFEKMTLKEFAVDVVQTTYILTTIETNAIFVNMATRKINQITQRPSKTRFQCSLPPSYSVSLDFGENHNLSNYYQGQNAEWEYKIVMSDIAQIQISCIKLYELSPMAFGNNCYSYSNVELHIKLLNTNENLVVASSKFGVEKTNRPDGYGKTYKLPDTLMLTDDWKMKISKSYLLCIKMSNNRGPDSWSSSTCTRRLGNPSQYPNIGYVVSCDVCSVELIFSVPAYSCPVKLITFTPIEL